VPQPPRRPPYCLRVRFRSARLAAAGLTLAAASLGLWLSLEPGDGQTRASGAPFLHFRTRPDLRPAPVTILHRASGTAPGYIFLAPKKYVDQAGPMILDDRGQVVWFDPLDARGVTDFKMQMYRGKPVLTWWQNTVNDGNGRSARVIMDSSYRIIRIVRRSGGLGPDIHDMQLTPRGTALMTVYEKIPYDLRPLGGPKDGYILEGVIQEVSVATGRVLWQWHSSKHVAITESYLPRGPKTGYFRTPFDYFHINSIDVDTDGNLLVSARHVCTVYKIRRSDGAIMWRLGGKKSNFTFGPGARFCWQHDARRRPDGTITIFDNHEYLPIKGAQSRAIALRVDEKTHRATLVRQYRHTPPILATSMANAQFLPDGHVFVGWGSEPYFTEYAKDGRVLLDARFGGERTDSYRAFRFPWVGHPTTKPAIAIDHDGDGLIVTVSWNGATRVARWQVLAGSDADKLRVVASTPKGGFETAIRLPDSPHYIAVRAVDGRGSVLRTSQIEAS